MILLGHSLSGPTTKREENVSSSRQGTKVSFCSSVGIATGEVESGFIGLSRAGHEIIISLLVMFIRYSLPILVSIAIMFWKVRIAM
jgi:hypothetical protein